MTNNTSAVDVSFLVELACRDAYQPETSGRSAELARLKAEHWDTAGAMIRATARLSPEAEALRAKTLALRDAIVAEDRRCRGWS